MDQTSLMKWIRWLNKEKKAESIWKMNDSFLPTGNRAKNLMISVYSKVSNRVFNFKKTTLFLPSYFGSSHTPFSQRSSCNSIESTSCSTTVSDRWDGREWERSYLTVPLTLRWDPSDPRIPAHVPAAAGTRDPGEFSNTGKSSAKYRPQNRSKGSICLDVRLVRMFSW